MHLIDSDSSVDLFDIEEERARRFFVTRPVGYLVGALIVLPLGWLWSEPRMVWLAVTMVAVGGASLPMRRRASVDYLTGMLVLDTMWTGVVIALLGVHPLAASLLFAGHASTAYLTLPGRQARVVVGSVVTVLAVLGSVDFVPWASMTEGRITATEIVMASFGFLSVVVDFELIGRAIRLIGRRRRNELALANEIAEHRAAALRTVSHELRTPLTSIGGFAHFLTSADLSPEERTEFAQRITNESTHLNHLVDDLLASVRLEAGQLKLRVRPVAVVESAHQVAEVFRPRGVNVSIEVDPAHTVSADPARLGQILRNLLSNAEKYGGAAATMRSQQHADNIVLTVTDNGPGVDESERARIFEDFAQIGGASHLTGTGLGLGISRRLARAMGGDLRCVDTPVGACFELVLPAHA